MPKKKRSKLQDDILEAEERISILKKSLDALVNIRISKDMRCLDENVIMTLLCTKLTYVGVQCLIFSIKHVPVNMPKRSYYIEIIFRRALEDHGITVGEEVDVEVLIDLLKCCPKSMESDRDCNTSLKSLSTEAEFGYFKCITPPVSSCMKCGGTLNSRHQPTRVTFFEIAGPLPACKVILRCDLCALSYNPTTYGDKSGHKLYPSDIRRKDVVAISEEAFAAVALHEWMACLANHSWVSFEGFSEAYNDVVRQLKGDDTMKEFIQNKAAPSTSAQIPRVSGSQIQLQKKAVSDMFFNGELAHEIITAEAEEEYLFVHSSDREKHMERILSTIAHGTYTHDCHSDCQARGCGKLYVLDGCWKLQFQHCMFQEKQELSLGISLPNVCTATPQYGKAFCLDHSKLMEKAGCPVKLRDFLKGTWRQNSSQSGDGDDHDDNDGGNSDYLTDEQLSGIHDTVNLVVSRNLDKTKKTLRSAVLQSQGTTDFVEQFPRIIDGLDQAADSQPICSKNLGARKNPKRWSRGLMYLVRGGGHIELFRPLYRSESSTQVFLITITWLYGMLQEVPESQWEDLIISYDDMCHLDNLKVARADLPLPAPYNQMWKKVKKIIDRLHIKNHKDKRCHEVYNPDSIPDAFDTMVAEQTFIWASRFKRIVCTMPKIHHLFYMHRMNRRRNRYTSFCYSNGRKPLLPKVGKSELSSMDRN